MTLEVNLRWEAEQDLIDASGWYEEQSPGLGGRFLDEVLRALALVGENPAMFPEIFRGTRRALITRFPFGIYYKVEGDVVVVVAVMHGSRHPKRWKERT